MINFLLIFLEFVTIPLDITKHITATINNKWGPTTTTTPSPTIVEWGSPPRSPPPLPPKSVSRQSSITKIGHLINNAVNGKKNGESTCCHSITDIFKYLLYRFWRHLLIPMRMPLFILPAAVVSIAVSEP